MTSIGVSIPSICNFCLPVLLISGILTVTLLKTLVKHANRRFSLISLAVVILDQLTKFFAKKYLNFSTNTGVAFGMFKGFNIVFIIVAVLVILFILIYHKRVLKDKYSEIFTAFILGGAVGNLIDRISYGAVIDFIDVGFWPSFNIADAAISIGMVGLIIVYWKK